MDPVPTHAVYDTAANRLIDYVANGEGHAEAVRRLADYGTALTVLPTEEVWARMEQAATTAPREVTAATWHAMFHLLPPVGWTHDGARESFKMAEPVTGLVTAIYVRLETRYFTFQDSIRLSHAACCDRVRASLAYSEQAQTTSLREP